MTYAIAVLLITAAHVYRDGFPRLGSTTLARSLASFLCLAAGAIAFDSWQGAVLGLSIGIGFWTDRKHAEGQRARGWVDAGWLASSGLTSLAPLAVAAGVLLNPWLAFLALVGLAKVPIWFLTMRYLPSHQNRWAAVAFGFVVGAALVLQRHA